MKNKLYYVLFLVYAIVVAFIVYINGGFLGDAVSIPNLLINLGFLIIIGILFVISTVSFGRLNHCTDELVSVTQKMQEECKKAGGKSVWSEYQDRKDVFAEVELNAAFNKYRLRMKSYQTKRGYVNTCDIDEFINEDLLDRVGMNFYNSGVPGTLTGLGILGTFLGLSMGLGAFNGDDIFTISDNVGPLLSGMKVAFHTSVYGIFFSLIFTFVYRSIMADAYEKLEGFQDAFRQFAAPIAVNEDENSAAMVIYQASMANALKQTVDLLKGNALDQTAGVERIVNQFTEQMSKELGVQFKSLGNVLKDAADAQVVAANNNKQLVDAAAALVETSRNMQENFDAMQARQDEFAKELRTQRIILEKSCKEMNDEIGNQLFAFEQMRKLHEK